ncbi:MAG: hypothetical protein ACM3OH_08060 [Bacillota bacterium]|jgi:hypothetical protein
MKRILAGLTTLSLFTFASATVSTADAQSLRPGVAATAIFSLESGGGESYGGTALVGIGGHIDQPLGFRLDGTFVHGGGVWSELVTGDLIYSFHTPLRVLHPYLLAGGGFQHSPGFTKPMAKAGAGFDYHLFHRNRGTVLFGETTFNLLFRGSGAGTGEALQVNLGLKFFEG